MTHCKPKMTFTTAKLYRTMRYHWLRHYSIGVAPLNEFVLKYPNGMYRRVNVSEKRKDIEAIWFAEKLDKKTTH